MWIASVFAYVLAALLSPQTKSPAKPIDIHWVYVDDDLKWKTPPKGTTEGVRYCENAFLTVFFPSGDFVQVAVLARRSRGAKAVPARRGSRAKAANRNRRPLTRQLTTRNFNDIHFSNRNKIAM